MKSLTSRGLTFRSLTFRALALGLIAALTLASGSIQAEEIEGVEFAATVQAGDQPLELRSLGLLRYMVFFKAYVAALYLAPGVEARQVLSDVPKRLEIEYFYPISKDDFRSSTEEVIRRNVEPERFDALRARIDAFNALYQDVEPGDRYALTYLPGQGTELARNGQRLGIVEGADFASAVFAIWFGPEEIDAALKEQLLDDG